MDWSALDDGTEANGNGSNGVSYVGVVDKSDLGSNGSSQTPDPMPPANEAEDESTMVQKMRPGQYLSYGNKGMKKVLSGRPVAQHNGMPVYRTAPGQYVVARPTARTAMRRNAQRARVQQPMQGMGSLGIDWNAAINTALTTGLSAVGVARDWVQADAEREARAEALRLQAQESEAQRQFEREQATMDFEERLRREAEIARLSRERVAAETQERIAQMQAQASTPLSTGISSSTWVIGLIALGGLGAFGVLLAVLLKKDKEKKAEQHQ
jgi:hypothetical protein